MRILGHLSLCHPMNGNIDVTAFLAASKRTKASSEHSVSWNYNHIVAFSLLLGVCNYLETNHKHHYLLNRSVLSSSCDSAEFKENARQKKFQGTYSCFVFSSNVLFSFVHGKLLEFSKTTRWKQNVFWN